ncbi:MAG: branched-chain amino acid transporter permease [Acetanaerobacterium sp.]
MTLTPLHSLSIILVVAAITFLTRLAPFVLFSNGRPTPRAVIYLGSVLPPVIMAILVVYCLRSIDIASFPFGLPELIASVCVVGLHVWRRNTLLSILAGTVVYMVLVQLVFA